MVSNLIAITTCGGFWNCWYRCMVIRVNLSVTVSYSSDYSVLPIGRVISFTGIRGTDALFVFGTSVLSAVRFCVGEGVRCLVMVIVSAASVKYVMVKSLRNVVTVWNT